MFPTGFLSGVDLAFGIYRSAVQAVHRNRESLGFARACLHVADYAEVVFKSATYRLSGRGWPFLSLAMSRSGSQFQTTRAGSPQPFTRRLSPAGFRISAFGQYPQGLARFCASVAFLRFAPICLGSECNLGGCSRESVFFASNSPFLRLAPGLS